MPAWLPAIWTGIPRSKLTARTPCKPAGCVLNPACVGVRGTHRKLPTPGRCPSDGVNDIARECAMAWQGTCTGADQRTSAHRAAPSHFHP